MAKARKKETIAPTVQMTPEVFEVICSRIMAGESLRSICTEPAMPNKGMFFYWLNKAENSLHLDHYARALQIRADGYGEEIVELADEADPQTANAVKLKVDARKWVASRLQPKKYGDRSQIDHTTGGESFNLRDALGFEE
jgi:hypothetical protein